MLTKGDQMKQKRDQIKTQEWTDKNPDINKRI